MTWNVSMSEEARTFLQGLTDEEATEVGACIRLLSQFGPVLPRPYSGTLRNCRFANMKELRVPYARKQFRILYAFDSEQNAILLIGGDKVPLGEKRWYPKFIKAAEALYAAHEEELEAKRKEVSAADRAGKSTRASKAKRRKR